MKSGAIGTSFRKFIHNYVIGGLVTLAVASCGGGGGSAGTVSGTSGSAATGPASISLLFSSVELPSSGAAGTDVTVTALVKNANNNAVASTPITFTATSGALTAVQATTDANGRATASLGTSGDSTNRAITVTARAGTITATGTVNVVGTTVVVTGPGTITSGSNSDFTIRVSSQGGAAVPSVPVTVTSAKGNLISVKSSGGGTAAAPLTDATGTVVVTVNGSQAGVDVLTASAQGSSSSQSFNVNTLSLTVSTNATDKKTNISTCTAISARYENAGVGQSGTANISTTRGDLYSNSTCTTALASSSVPITSGDAQTVYIKSSTVGVATISATAVGGPTSQTTLEFVAPTPSKINFQADPAVVAPSGTGQSNVSELTVVVRDASNNLVQGAVVEFTIMSDQSGGTLSSPVATTASNGSAKVSFLAGSATTATDGVQIRARVQGTSISHTVALTVSRKALFITAGTGNTIATPSSTQYRQDYSVFVTDASGNPVSGVTVTAAIRVTNYKKGTYSFDSDPLTPETGWGRIVVAVCPNEDVDKNGILDTSEDTNGNGVLDPRTGISVSSAGLTDATGTATVSILYPRDRGGWTEIEMTINGSVAGTEGTYKTLPYYLPMLSTDLSNQAVNPPGDPNPYGASTCNVPN